MRRWAAGQLPVFGAWAVGAAVFFRAQWESGFGRLTGLGGDSTFIVYILEHWFRVLHGQASWANPPMYYPVKGLLGWSDGLVLFEVIYAPLRWLGADQLLAAELMLVLLSLVAFTTFVALVRRLFDPPLLVALTGALVFTFANGLWYEGGHYQLLAIWFVPGIALLGVHAWASESRLRSCGLGAATGALVGLLFFTSFYIAWFCVPLGAVAFVAGLVLQPRRFIRAVAAAGRRLWPAGLAAGAGFGVAMIPFADVYLPAEGKVPSADYSLIIHGYGHGWHGVFDLGRGNVMWSSVLRHFHAVFVPDQGSAVTPILLVASVILAVVAYLAGRGGDGAGSRSSVAAPALAAAAVIGFLLPVRVGDHSLWALVWHLPGGNAVRAIYRIGLMTSALAVTSLTASVSALWRRSATSRGRTFIRPALAVVMVLVVVEQLNTQPFSNLDRRRTLAFIASVRPAPAGCHSFYMNYSQGSPVPRYEFQVDAMFAAQKVGLPTLDGYTGYNPPGWDLTTFGPTLDTSAIRWAADHHLAGLCRLDVSDMSWTLMPATNA